MNVVTSTSAPKKETEQGENGDEPHQPKKYLPSSRHSLIPVQLIVIFLIDHVALLPPFLDPLPSLPSRIRRPPETAAAGNAAGRGSSGMAAVGRVRRGLHGAVVARCSLRRRRRRRRLIEVVVGVSRRTLHVVLDAFWGALQGGEIGI